MGCRGGGAKCAAHHCLVCVCGTDAGGFAEFKAKYPSLCSSTEMRHSGGGGGGGVKSHVHQHSSLSQPCLPVSNVGPTRVLPFLFLGSQLDSMSRETMLVSPSVRLSVDRIKYT